ncbi:MAG: heterodisulfide reductase-related iron-sulfur binding cluster [Myxococcota bacterium]
MALDYEDPDYLDTEKLEAELRRVGEICHQCRRCLPLCPSFPKLFELVDASDDETAGVAMQGFEEVNELCYHCKLCYNHCPYTPPHEWALDFPALMRRHQLSRAQRNGIPLARRLTTNTDLLGTIGSHFPKLMNFANRNRVSRVAMEKTLGIHRDWVQPSYYAETVQRWFQRREPATAGANGHAVFFTTCSVNYNDPIAGRSAVEVLEHSDIRVDLCYERCCGMPFTDTGDLDAARRNAERNVADLLPFVEAGAHVVVPGPSCSLMLKQEYPELLGSPEAKRVAEATRDLMEYLYDLARAKKLARDFQRPLGRVAYHAPCHLRHQNIGFRGRDLLKLAGGEVTLVDACSGVDGTWGMQARFHSQSLKVASAMAQRIRDAEAEHIATDCPLSALRIQEVLGRNAVHPVVLLRHAYGIGTE